MWGSLSLTGPSFRWLDVVEVVFKCVSAIVGKCRHIRIDLILLLLLVVFGGMVRAACGRKTDSSQEMVALGLGSLFCSFFGCLPLTASFSRSSVMSSTGNKTPFASFFVSTSPPGCRLHLSFLPILLLLLLLPPPWSLLILFFCHQRCCYWFWFDFQEPIRLVLLLAVVFFVSTLSRDCFAFFFPMEDNESRKVFSMFHLMGFDGIY